MASPGDSIAASEYEEISFISTAADTDGTLLEVEVTYEPNSDRPPPHYHPSQTEHFEVIAGIFSAEIDGKATEYHPGDTFQVPAGTIHSMHNISAEQGKLRWQIRPAMRTEDFFQSLWTLERDLLASGSSPSLLHFALILSEFHDEYRMAKIPYLVQLIWVGVLAQIARMRGYPRVSELLGH
jgi:quercetin dioxygenase-like cupin family protein